MKRLAGAIFCLIAALLEAGRYIAAAVYVSGMTTWSSDMFATGLEYVGDTLKYLAIAALAVGILYIVWGELDERKQTK